MADYYSVFLNLAVIICECQQGMKRFLLLCIVIVYAENKTIGKKYFINFIGICSFK
jgi:hypothetical protein